MRLKNLSYLSFPRKRESNFLKLDPRLRGGDGFPRQIFSAILLAVFTLNQTIPAYALDLPAILPAAAPFLNNIQIPETFGRVEEVYQGKTDELVVFIQDAHANYSAQQSIASLIDLFVRDHHFSVVGQEAAEGRIDTTLLRAFPMAEAKRKVMDRYLRRGEIGGAEYLAVAGDQAFDFVGVDKRKLYLKNLSEFFTLLDSKENGIALVKTVRTAMKNLEDTVYSKRQREFRELLIQYRNRQVDLKAFLGELKKYALSLGEDVSRYGQLSKLFASDQPSLKELDVLRLQYEIDELTFALRARLAETPLEKELISLDEYLSLLQAGFKIELSREDFLRLCELHALFAGDRMVQFLTEHSEHFRLAPVRLQNIDSEMEPLFAKIQNFYRTASERDAAFVKQIRREMHLRNERNSILVTGGFHKNGITKKLREKGVSYAVIMPHISEPDSRDNYIRLMEKNRALVKSPERNALGLPSPLGTPEYRSQFQTRALVEMGVEDPSLLKQQGIYLFGDAAFSSADLLTGARRWNNRRQAGEDVDLIDAVRSTATKISQPASKSENAMPPQAKERIRSAASIQGTSVSSGFGTGQTILLGFAVFGVLAIGRFMMPVLVKTIRKYRNRKLAMELARLFFRVDLNGKSPRMLLRKIRREIYRQFPHLGKISFFRHPFLKIQESLSVLDLTVALSVLDQIMSRNMVIVEKARRAANIVFLAEQKLNLRDLTRTFEIQGEQIGESLSTSKNTIVPYRYLEPASGTPRSMEAGLNAVEAKASEISSEGSLPIIRIIGEKDSGVTAFIENIQRRDAFAGKRMEQIFVIQDQWLWAIGAPRDQIDLDELPGLVIVNNSWHMNRVTVEGQSVPQKFIDVLVEASEEEHWARLMRRAQEDTGVEIEVAMGMYMQLAHQIRERYFSDSVKLKADILVYSDELLAKINKGIIPPAPILNSSGFGVRQEIDGSKKPAAKAKGPTPDQKLQETLLAPPWYYYVFEFFAIIFTLGKFSLIRNYKKKMRDAISQLDRQRDALASTRLGRSAVSAAAPASAKPANELAADYIKGRPAAVENLEKFLKTGIDETNQTGANRVVDPKLLWEYVYEHYFFLAFHNLDSRAKSEMIKLFDIKGEDLVYVFTYGKMTNTALAEKIVRLENLGRDTLSVISRAHSDKGGISKRKVYLLLPKTKDIESARKLIEVFPAVASHVRDGGNIRSLFGREKRDTGFGSDRSYIAAKLILASAVVASTYFMVQAFLREQLLSGYDRAIAELYQVSLEVRRTIGLDVGWADRLLRSPIVPIHQIPPVVPETGLNDRYAELSKIARLHARFVVRLENAKQRLRERRLLNVVQLWKNIRALSLNQRALESRYAQLLEQFGFASSFSASGFGAVKDPGSEPTPRYSKPWLKWKEEKDAFDKESARKKESKRKADEKKVRAELRPKLKKNVPSLKWWEWIPTLLTLGIYWFVRDSVLLNRLVTRRLNELKTARTRAETDHAISSSRSHRVSSPRPVPTTTPAPKPTPALRPQPTPKPASNLPAGDKKTNYLKARAAHILKMTKLMQQGNWRIEDAGVVIEDLDERWDKVYENSLFLRWHGVPEADRNAITDFLGIVENDLLLTVQIKDQKIIYESLKTMGAKNKTPPKLIAWGGAEQPKSDDVESKRYLVLPITAEVPNVKRAKEFFPLLEKYVRGARDIFPTDHPTNDLANSREVNINLAGFGSETMPKGEILRQLGHLKIEEGDDSARLEQFRKILRDVVSDDWENPVTASKFMEHVLKTVEAISDGLHPITEEDLDSSVFFSQEEEILFWQEIPNLVEHMVHADGKKYQEFSSRVASLIETHISKLHREAEEARRRAERADAERRATAEAAERAALRPKPAQRSPASKPTRKLPRADELADLRRAARSPVEVQITALATRGRDTVGIEVRFLTSVRGIIYNDALPGGETAESFIAKNRKPIKVIVRQIRDDGFVVFSLAPDEQTLAKQAATLAELKNDERNAWMQAEKKIYTVRIEKIISARSKVHGFEVSYKGVLGFVPALMGPAGFRHQSVADMFMAREKIMGKEFPAVLLDIREANGQERPSFSIEQGQDLKAVEGLKELESDTSKTVPVTITGFATLRPRYDLGSGSIVGLQVKWGDSTGRIDFDEIPQRIYESGNLRRLFGETFQARLSHIDTYHRKPTVKFSLISPEDPEFGIHDHDPYAMERKLREDLDAAASAFSTVRVIVTGKSRNENGVHVLYRGRARGFLSKRSLEEAGMPQDEFYSDTLLGREFEVYVLRIKPGIIDDDFIQFTLQKPRHHYLEPPPKRGSGFRSAASSSSSSLAGGDERLTPERRAEIKRQRAKEKAQKKNPWGSGFGAIDTNVVFFDFGGVLAEERGANFAELVSAELLKRAGVQRKGIDDRDFNAFKNLVVLPKPERAILHTKPEAFLPWLERINHWLIRRGASRQIAVEEFKELFFAGRPVNPHILAKLDDLKKIKEALGVRFGVIVNFEAAGEEHLKRFIAEKFGGLIDQDLIVISGTVGQTKETGPQMFEAALRKFKESAKEEPRNPIFIDNDASSFEHAQAAGITNNIHYALESGKAPFTGDQLFQATLQNSGQEPVFEMLLGKSKFVENFSSPVVRKILGSIITRFDDRIYLAPGIFVTALHHAVGLGINDPALTELTPEQYDRMLAFLQREAKRDVQAERIFNMLLGSNEQADEIRKGLAQFIQSLKGLTLMTEELFLESPEAALGFLMIAAWNETNVTRSQLDTQMIAQMQVLVSYFPQVQTLMRSLGVPGDTESISDWLILMFPASLDTKEKSLFKRFFTVLRSDEFRKASLILTAKDMMGALAQTEQGLDGSLKAFLEQKPDEPMLTVALDYVLDFIRPRGMEFLQKLKERFFDLYGERLKTEGRLEEFQRGFEKEHRETESIITEWRQVPTAGFRQASQGWPKTNEQAFFNDLFISTVRMVRLFENEGASVTEDKNNIIFETTHDYSLNGYLRRLFKAAQKAGIHAEEHNGIYGVTLQPPVQVYEKLHEALKRDDLAQTWPATEPEIKFKQAFTQAAQFLSAAKSEGAQLIVDSTFRQIRLEAPSTSPTLKNRLSNLKDRVNSPLIAGVKARPSSGGNGIVFEFDAFYHPAFSVLDRIVQDAGFGKQAGTVERLPKPGRQEIIRSVKEVVQNAAKETAVPIAGFKTIVFSSAADLARFEKAVLKYSPAVREQVLGTFQEIVAGWDVGEGDKNKIWLRLSELFSSRGQKIYVGRNDRNVFSGIRGGAEAVLLGQKTEYLLQKVEDQFMLEKMSQNGDRFMDVVLEALYLKQLAENLTSVAA